MTAPISFTHSPFLYHHVPNSPYLMPTRPQVTQSPVPFVPDIDNQRDNRLSTSSLLHNGRDTSRRPQYLRNHSLLSPSPVVPSISAPPTPQQATTSTISGTPQKEQVVPHFSPVVLKNPMNRTGRRLNTSPRQGLSLQPWVFWCAHDPFHIGEDCKHDIYSWRLSKVTCY